MLSQPAFFSLPTHPRATTIAPLLVPVAEVDFFVLHVISAACPARACLFLRFKSTFDKI